MRRVLCLFMICGIICGLVLMAPTISATETEKEYTADYWRNADWSEEGTFEAWSAWLEDDPDLSVLFDLNAQGLKYAAASYGMAIKLGDLFLEDPIAFIQILSSAESGTREYNIAVFPGLMYLSNKGYNVFLAVVNSIELREEHTQEMKDTLQAIKDSIATYQEEPNPKTADNAQMFVALVGMLVCGTGLIVVRRRIV